MDVALDGGLELPRAHAALVLPDEGEVAGGELDGKLWGGARWRGSGDFPFGLVLRGPEEVEAHEDDAAGEDDEPQEAESEGAEAPEEGVELVIGGLLLLLYLVVGSRR